MTSSPTMVSSGAAGPGAAGWTPVVALAVSSQVIGQGLLVFALKHFPPLIVGMALLTQPAIAAM
ncbi:MAG: EamA family transporter, partial [Egibacteraceae bacterium]